MLQKLFAIHNSVLEGFDSTRKRYLYDRINWDVQALCVTGARGVGKTTLLLQHYKERYDDPRQCLYISGDSIHVAALGLFDSVQKYFDHGGKAVIIDEIHKYPNWAQELKNIIDTFRNRKILVSGSSSLDLKRAKYDLSRRVVYYELKGLSFREYLAFSYGLDLPSSPLDTVLRDHVAIASDLSARQPVLQRFKEYLQHGFYPYYLEGVNEYPHRVMNTVEKVLFEDIAVIDNLTQAKLPVLKKMLWLLASSKPFMLNLSGMSRDLGITRTYVAHYLELLELAGLVTLLTPDAKGAALVRKSGKLYFDNTNLIYAIEGSLPNDAESGTLRETFLVNQLRTKHAVTLHDKADLIVDGDLAVEIGGTSKKKKQLRGATKGIVAMDGVTVGAGDTIPLYLFGMLY